MRGNGNYSLPMVDYALEKNLIQHENIKYTVQAILKIPHNYYVEFIDLCYSSLEKYSEIETFYNDMNIDGSTVDFRKLSINTMIGGFKPNLNKNVQWKSVCITANSCEAYKQFIKNNGCFIEVIRIKDVKFFHVYKETLHTSCESEKPIYDQIMDLEAIELHKMAMLIQEKGGKVLDLNTDCVSCSFPDNKFPFELNVDGKNICGYYYENGEPKYKLEPKKTRLQVERKQQYKRNEIYVYKPKNWTIYEDVKDNNFTPLVNTVLDLNTSFFITGPAGTGKSKLIRQIKTRLDTEKKTCLCLLDEDKKEKKEEKEEYNTYECLAPTNLAAINIEGVTIHKFVSKLKNMKSLYNMDYDYIFVDEISMVKEIFYKFFIMLKQIKPDIKFVIVGDYSQLKPINDRIDIFEHDFDYANSQALKELCDFQKLELSTCRRSDNKLYNMCKFENINNISKDAFKSIFTDRHF
jgi:nucleoside-triphosphatase THEP1